ncbi:hypothetical protein F5H01DRAFT_124675 [Linnemannia elongata]|uniref:Uncharacterized protein n=1 Tax=Linnemannia elongata AG-77 TaxID=1314771 RepID=A0A197KDV8_9FUNG|nr:hypothetical protein F5H01DRAFT_124675 [Linnemannia elongata]OAQ35892.1 hypothetical protein K457DRAFT_132537 [Linnemannia elongata AG-77]
MSFFMPNKLNPQGQKLLTIIIALPVFVSSTYVLYKRVVLEEDPRRHVPHRNETNDLLAQFEADMEKERRQQQQHQEQPRS